MAAGALVGAAGRGPPASSSRAAGRGTAARVAQSGSLRRAGAAAVSRVHRTSTSTSTLTFTSTARARQAAGPCPPIPDPAPSVQAPDVPLPIPSQRPRPSHTSQPREAAKRQRARGTHRLEDRDDIGCMMKMMYGDGAPAHAQPERRAACLQMGASCDAASLVGSLHRGGRGRGTGVVVATGGARHKQQQQQPRLQARAGRHSIVGQLPGSTQTSQGLDWAARVQSPRTVGRLRVTMTNLGSSRPVHGSEAGARALGEVGHPLQRGGWTYAGRGG